MRSYKDPKADLLLSMRPPLLHPYALILGPHFGWALDPHSTLKALRAARALHSLTWVTWRIRSTAPTLDMHSCLNYIYTT